MSENYNHHRKPNETMWPGHSTADSTMRAARASQMSGVELPGSSAGSTMRAMGGGGWGWVSELAAQPSTASTARGGPGGRVRLKPVEAGGYAAL